MKIVLCTGGYDPVHSGHIAYFSAARELGDKLYVGLNSDAWLRRKKGSAFMPWSERAAVVAAMHVVDRVIEFDDSDGSSCAAIEAVKQLHPDHEIIFANGGDRTAVNIPEMAVQDVIFKFGVGGEDKKNSSSWILQEWKAPQTQRQWGYYRVLHEVAGMKVKELTVNPGQSLSMQRHQHRAEYWIVSEGECMVNSQLAGGYALPPTHLRPHQEFRIAVGDWHQLTNPFDVPCKIVEIQYGDQCSEEDIERK
jgi:cytidyltransferase-like protein